MTKRIAIKYAFLIVAVITAVSLIFVPVYIYVQKSIYINIESREIDEFCIEFKNEVDFSDIDEIENYLNDNNEKSYAINVYNSSQEQIFTNQRRKINNNAENSTHTKKIPSHNISKYSTDSKPVYYEKDTVDNENIALRKIIKNNGKEYYVLIRESLKNNESIFAYTNSILVFILIMYIIVCGVCLFLLINSLTKSIRTLNSAVKKISAKDYSVRYKGKFPNDEVGTLARNFNVMADTIQDNINSIRNYNFLLKEDIDNLKKYESMRTKFVRNTTHELKTPLAIISSQVEMMNCTEDEEKRDYYFNSAMDEIQKMSSLITSFLKYSVEETETFKNSSENINLSEKAKELCDKISGTMQSKKIDFKSTIQPGLYIEISETHIEHIFNNYLMNAMKYTPEGGKIRVSLKNEDSGYLLSVFNEGKKIPENQLEKIWNEFYSENKYDENVGLGLFIVKEISLINHMECGVKNKKNGVEFWFRFNKADN